MSGGGLVDAFRTRSGDMTFLDRLDLVRGRMIASIVVLVLTTAFGFYLTTAYDVLGILAAPVEPYLGGGRLKYLSPTDPFFITLRIAIFIGVVLALPFLVAQLWALVAPLLLPDEKRFVKPAFLGSIGLFVAGVAFCYVFVLPLMMRFTMGFQTESLEQMIVVAEYLKLVMRMLVVFGLAFELPIVILVGTLLGIVSPTFLAEKRRHAIAILLISSAIVTPPDLGSLMLLLIPLLVLYEVSIFLSKMIAARRAAALAVSEV